MVFGNIKYVNYTWFAMKVPQRKPKKHVDNRHHYGNLVGQSVRLQIHGSSTSNAHVDKLVSLGLLQGRVEKSNQH